MNHSETLPMFDFYEKYYAAVEVSAAYAGFCRRLFGLDLSQQGFCDMEQLKALLDQAGIRKDETVLDIGCGNGKMAEYISDTTGAEVYGFDYSPAAIAGAQRRTGGKTDRLFFRQGCIGQPLYKKGMFDCILSVDTLYFAEDLAATLRQMSGWLKPSGRLALFYSEFEFDQTKDGRQFFPHETALAHCLKALGLPYRVFDFSDDHFRHMKRKREIILSMEEEFKREGTAFLFDAARRESIDTQMSIEAFRRFSCRYLYVTS